MSTTVTDSRSATAALLAGNAKSRERKDRLMTGLVWFAFALAIVPLISLLWTVLDNGSVRFGIEFLSYSMRNVFGGMDAGGANHAITGTLLITAAAAVISVPIGLLVAIYLVEYGRTARSLGPSRSSWTS